MTMKRAWVLLLLVGAMALPTVACADILFDTGAPQPYLGGWFGWGSFYNDNQHNNMFARPFSIDIAQGAYLEEIHFWSLFVAPTYPIQFDLYDADLSGQPTQLLNSWYVSEQDIMNGKLFHIDEPGEPTDGLKVGWRLPSQVELAPNKYYALAIYGVGSPEQAPRPVYWTVNTPPSDQGPLSFVSKDGGGTWKQFDPGEVGLGQQFGRNALELVGTAIPEPLTVLLMTLGLAPMAGLVRRKK